MIVSLFILLVIAKEMWKEIVTDIDIQSLMIDFGFFHDSCLRDIYISTKEYVDQKLAMNFDNSIVGTLLFQRQFKKNSVIELRFDKVDRFNFNPLEDGNYGVIYEATFKKVDNLFYWYSEESWDLSDNDAIWISSKKVFWRERLGMLGNVNRLKEQ